MTLAHACFCWSKIEKKVMAVKLMEQYKDLKRLANEEDEAIARALADALCQDNVEKFLQLYDEIPSTVSLKRLSNIKEMARQLAALTRTTTYRHGPMPGKDSTYFGINHPLQTSQLTLGNGSLGSNDFSAFKTPPEGCTPIDSKQFDYEEETLKTLGVDRNNLSLSTLLDGNDQLNDSGILQTDGLSNTPDLGETLKNEKHCKMYDVDVTKTDDDAFHTPPEFQDNIDPPFGYPPSSDKLITSAINLLSKMSTENLEGETKEEYSMGDTKEITTQKEGEDPDNLIEELTGSSNEKDSLDGSPSSRNSFVQEEEDSGISTVEENDISRDSPIAMNDHDSGDGKMEDKSNQRVYSKSPTISEKRTCSSPPEPKFACSNFHDTEEAGVGWQTRYKRIGRKPNLKNDRRSNFCDKESYGQNGRNDSQDTPQRSFRGAKIRERNTTKVEKIKRNGNRYPDDLERNREINGWTNKKSEDDELFEPSSATYMKRPSRHGGSLPYGGKKTEGRWAKNSSREKYGEAESGRQEHALGYNSSSGTSQSSVFSYRDALLKASSKGSNSKDGSEQKVFPFKAEIAVFDFHLAASYLSSEWTNVNNLYKKDPSKVFIYSDDYKSPKIGFRP